MQSFSCYLCKETSFRDVMPYRAVKTDTLFQNCRVVKCKNCGLLQINKKFTNAEIENYYKSEYDRDTIYKFEKEKFPGDNPWSVFRGRALAKLLLLQGGKLSEQPNILDLGCGYGHLLLGFTEFINTPHQVIGVEYSTQSKEIFEQKKWVFHEGGIDDVYRAYAGKINVLITSHVFEHIISPHDFLQKCKTMLNEKGVLLWEVPNLNQYNLACEQRHSPHICLWDLQSIEKVLSMNGLEITFLSTAGKKYSWMDKQHFIINLLRKYYNALLSNNETSVSLYPRENIGFQLDEYGKNRRNLRIIAMPKK